MSKVKACQTVTIEHLGRNCVAIGPELAGCSKPYPISSDYETCGQEKMDLEEAKIDLQNVIHGFCLAFESSQKELEGEQDFIACHADGEIKIVTRSNTVQETLIAKMTAILDWIKK